MQVETATSEENELCDADPQLEVMRLERQALEKELVAVVGISSSRVRTNN